MQVKLYTPPKPKKAAAAPENIVGNVKDVEGPLKYVSINAMNVFLIDA